ncbi:hypothetical protein B0I72DRAFT_103802 [Yarrowia lipolytica]|jgi:hypothetical protein|uniref:YALI0E11143p n=2 Tax=Yarrowia lipolytica TaxID=4952 RepID=Q6C6A2_YARLI|nr:YALI0E11143p [Yarrowia lipolytica CLIB122]AOW05265.1 hypothetical protein YALI1_E13963g [Yarrowia lipolytica]KAB8283839.1 hypothetical protein BKA91DRAFT_110940 [Yarrowia lipolytica]KAE8172764.1 hypothetical protein BKA90DRAFT_168098 [Yarrowia lipolytica]KAJ8056788.1 hypothetical protein LXG23DRAFT_33674 [Yarrowia lipolytica]QNQ00221.1 Hypothetical protein YALI2_E01536g [Yarrowia lipolytica]|eukprot:XP_503810.1 YALI0E11143p [Yarrowia lipolytica CLIB122]
MTGLFSFLWPSSTTPAITIPTYYQGDNEDHIDLQIKSLTFMYKRCNRQIHTPFRRDSSEDMTKDVKECLMRHKLNKKRSHQVLPTALSSEKNNLRPSRSEEDFTGMTASEVEKLDIMYNRSEFERQLFNDQHRITIDWAKNKFRSVCILTAMPAHSSTLPVIDKLNNCKFTLLRADATDEEYIRTLADSDLYREHNIARNTRMRFARDCIDRTRDAKQPSSANFTKDERALIIRTFLQKLAVEVQVQRLYRGAFRERLREKEKESTKGTLKLHKSASKENFKDFVTSSSRDSLRDTIFQLEESSAIPNAAPRPSTPRSPKLEVRSLNIPTHTPSLKGKKSHAELFLLMSPEKQKSYFDPPLSPPKQQSSPSPNSSPTRSPRRQYNTPNLPITNSGTSSSSNRLKKKASTMSLGSGCGAPHIPPPPTYAPSTSPESANSINSCVSTATSTTSISSRTTAVSEATLSEDTNRELLAQARIAVRSRLESEKMRIFGP